MIVTIDGPAGAGKSTAARGLAARLGYTFLDTGAMFRAVALSALRAGVAWTDDAGLADLLPALRLEMRSGGVVLLNDEDVSGLIRTPEVAQGASVVAVRAAVRSRLADMQRHIAASGRIVTEGRDQGTVVFPNAECKFFLVADAEERLQRRARDLRNRGQSVNLDELRSEQTVRDERDSKRDLAPLRKADDAIEVDTTGLTVEQVVDRLEAMVRQRMG